MLTRSGMRAGDGHAQGRRRRGRAGRRCTSSVRQWPATAARRRQSEAEDQGQTVEGVWRPGRARLAASVPAAQRLQPGLGELGGDQSDLAGGSVDSSETLRWRRSLLTQLEGRPRLQFERAWRPAESRIWRSFTDRLAGSGASGSGAVSTGLEPGRRRGRELCQLSPGEDRSGLSRSFGQGLGGRRVARRCWVGLGPAGALREVGRSAAGAGLSSTRLSRALKNRNGITGAPCRHGCKLFGGEETVPQIGQYAVRIRLSSRSGRPAFRCRRRPGVPGE